MKKLTILAMLLPMTVFAAQEKTPLEDFLFDLELSSVQYMLKDTTLFVLGDAEPSDMCALANEYEAGIELVINYNTKGSMSCVVPK